MISFIPVALSTYIKQKILKNYVLTRSAPLKLYSLLARVTSMRYLLDSHETTIVHSRANDEKDCVSNATLKITPTFLFA